MNDNVKASDHWQSAREYWTLTPVSRLPHQLGCAGVSVWVCVCVRVCVCAKMGKFRLYQIGIPIDTNRSAYHQLETQHKPTPHDGLSHSQQRNNRGRTEWFALCLCIQTLPDLGDGVTCTVTESRWIHILPASGTGGAGQAGFVVFSENLRKRIDCVHYKCHYLVTDETNAFSSCLTQIFALAAVCHCLISRG
jgi:hypothetical protein